MIMMCVCVLILPVCFTRRHGMFLVLYRVTNHMAGAPPSLSETGTYIWHNPGQPHPPPRGWSWFPAPPPVGVGGVVVDGWECWLMES